MFFLLIKASPTKCAEVFGFSTSAIWRLFKKYNETGSVDDLPRAGHPHEIEEEKIKEIAAEIQKPYSSTRSVALKCEVSNYTVFGIAHDHDLNFRHFTEIPKLSEFNKKLRFKFCELNMDDNFDNWIFGDESAFKIFRNTQGQWTSKSQICVEKIDSYNTSFQKVLFQFFTIKIFF